MAFVRVFFAVAGQDGGRQLFSTKLGVHEPRVGPTIDGIVAARDVSVAASTMATLWDTSVAADFNLIVIQTANADVVLELTTDVSNATGDELWTTKLHPDIPFILGSDASYANYTAGFGGGTLAKVNRIRCKNLGTTAARVEVLSVT